MRFRLTAMATAVVAVVLILTGAFLVENQHRTLMIGLDEALEQRADDVEDLLDGATLPEALPRGIDDDAVAQVVDRDGNVIASSTNLATTQPLGPVPDDGDDITTIDELPDDPTTFRLLSRVVERDGTTYVIHVAANPDDIDDSVATLTRALLIVIPLVTALLAALLWWLTGRALRPVESIRAEVAAMDGADLDRRVPEPARDDEIGRLARTMNSMLDRIEESSVRQQQFVADASHDLRSPLTRMRSEIEIDLAHPDAADLRATHESVLEDTIELQHLVDDLLHLARADAGAVSVDAEPVDLDDLVLREAQRLRASGRVEVDVHHVSAAQVTGDRGQLTRAIRNLTENAERHAVSTVTLEVREDADSAVVVVGDDGPGIPVADRERIFERFTRLDAARTGADGSGLGLAIVRDIVTRHGGTVIVDTNGSTTGARFVVTFPTAP